MNGSPGEITEAPKEQPCKAPAYAWIYPQLVKVAREHGYALAIHGSCNRDLDLLAVPWTDNAAEPIALIEAIRGRIDGVIVPTGTHGGRWDGTKFVDAIVENPSKKPHGRLAWNIHFTSCEFYLDVSVMPRTASVKLTEGRKHAEALQEAKKLYRLGYDAALSDGTAAHEKTRKEIGDKLDAAAAYLDSLPGDGGELADGHWLNTQGLGQTLDCAYGLSWQNDAGNICVCFTDTDGDAVWLQINPNRAAVRNLIAAINWELTPATGGE